MMENLSFLTCEINGCQYVLPSQNYEGSLLAASITSEIKGNHKIIIENSNELTNDQLSQLHIDNSLENNVINNQSDGAATKKPIENVKLNEPINLDNINNDNALIDSSELPFYFINLPLINSNESNVNEQIENSPNNFDLISNYFVELIAAFKCKICPFTTENRDELLPHFQTQHFNLKNEVQNKENNQKSENKEPTNLPKNDNVKLVYMCAACSNCFPTVENCREHMIKDHGLMDAAQSLISNNESDNSNSNDDFEINDGKEDDDDERTTKKTKSKVENKKIKIDADGKERTVKCLHRGCVYKFISEEMMLKHVAYHDESSPNPNHFKCNTCPDMKFNRWKMCCRHLWKSHGIEIDLLICNICTNFKTMSNVKLSDHMRVHSDNRDFICSDCGKGFKQATQLRNHRVSHLDKKNAVTSRWYSSKTCDICEKTYADSKCLKNHIQAVHSKLKPYVCNVCGHASSRKAMLQLHLRQHTGDKPFSCDKCDFKTGDHNTLRRHMMRHTGVKPYKCPHCPYSSIQSISLKNHFKTKHPSLSGLFNCDLCPFKTVKKKIYIEHISDHEKGLIKPATGKNHKKKNNDKGIDDVEVFPGNVAATELVYHCLGAFSKEGKIEANFMSSSTSPDGSSQTITIQIPSTKFDSSLSHSESAIRNGTLAIEQEDEETMHCFLKIPHEEEEHIDTGGITIPAEPEDSTILNVES